MYNPLKQKYWPFYMRLAEEAAQQSTSQVAKVGAVLVLSSGMISTGWNGTPAGEDNCCEDHTKLKQDEVTGEYRYPTKPQVIHAEMNVFDKLIRQGLIVSGTGGVLFTTLSPCEKCCEYLVKTGILAVVYKQTYKHTEHLDILHKAGITTAYIS